MRRQNAFIKAAKHYTKSLQIHLKVLHTVPRETLIIAGTALLIVIGMPVFYLTRNAPSPIVIIDVPPVTTAVPFTKLTEGKQSVIARRVNYVLRSPTELNELWKTVNAPGTPPKVDFRKNAVIAVFAGQEASASIAVAKIEDSHTRMVSIAIARPSVICSKGQSTELPYQIVAVPATSLPLTHEDLSMTASCPK